MRSLAPKLVLAALVAAAVPAAALAHDRDFDRDDHRSPAAYGADGGWRGGPAPGWRDGDRWRARAHREREAAEIRAEMQQLDAQRAEFYEHGAWNPARVRSFERWYAWRRAELDQRWNALQPLAWR